MSQISSKCAATGSPTSMSTIRVPPYRVVTRTAPAGCSLDFSDDLGFLAARAPAQRVERSVGILRRDDRQELAFIRDVQRIEPQQFAGAAHRVAHGNRSSKSTMPRPQSRASSFSEVATPPRVGSRIQRIAGPGPAARASTSGRTERVSERRSASKSSSPRASRIVMP